MCLIVNCGDPNPPLNGSLGKYPHTREGASVAFWCNDEPSSIMNSTCMNTSLWKPPPGQHRCTSVNGME